MHYNKEAHAELVATKTPTLDHPVTVLSDDNAYVHFTESAANSLIVDPLEKLESNIFMLSANGIRSSIK